MPDEPLVARATTLTRAIGHGLHRSGGVPWLQVDLSLAQLRCLFTIADQAPMTIGGVARQLGIGLSSASAHVDRLVEQGLVHRREDPADRRRTLVSVTDSGAALSERLRQGSLHALSEWLRALPRDDLLALVRGLEALARAADLPECPAPFGLPAAPATSQPLTKEA